jgi:excisionase family DNA binding protein
MKIENESSKLLLTARETAKALSISERKLWNLTNENEIPAIRIGRSVRYAIEDIQVWIETKRNEGNCVQSRD